MAHLPETQFTMTRGDAKSFRVTVKNDAGAAVDLTGASIEFVVRKHPHSSTAVITKDDSDGIIVEDAAGGVFRIDLDPADTSALGNWRHELGFDVQVTIAGKPATVARGSLVIEPEYTT